MVNIKIYIYNYKFIKIYINIYKTYYIIFKIRMKMEKYKKEN